MGADGLAGLESPALSARHPGRRIWEASLRRRGVGKAHPPAREPWSASFFGLDGTSAFRALNKRKRQAVLQDCSRSLLVEAYFIEKLGLSFASKMALAADSTEERAVHCLFAADEAVHLAQVGAFLPDAPQKTSDAFLRWLAAIVEEMPPRGARLLIQILLEGWGISHYRELARGCSEPALRAALSAIARDEVLHHRAGVTLFEERRLKGRERRQAQSRVDQLFDMVRAGPVRVAGAVERAHGGLGRAGRARLMEELGAGAHAASRLAILRKLLASAGAGALIPV